MTRARVHLDAVQLRPATAADAATLLEMRNDAEAVRFSRTGRPVSAQEHERWLVDRLARSQPDLWIAESDGRPVGQVRVDVNDGTGEVSVAVAAGERGRGLATAMLLRLLQDVAATPDLLLLGATIHIDNQASLSAFQGAGFVMSDREGDFLRLQRRLPERGE